ncbi:MAG: autotransporter outer membrane beta-barrel domain-containing protein [Burkholderiaceae bacterium]|nr:autotransporter outer membrane beta-barrel domain-containing protein [Burkholderiaceae bacterium]
MSRIAYAVLLTFITTAVNATPMMATTSDVTNSLTDGVVTRLSMAGPLFNGTERIFNGGDPWSMIKGEKNEAKRYVNIDGEKFGYKAELAGLQVGYDHAIGNYRLGVSLLGETGDIKSIGEPFKTDSDFYGASLYGTWTGKRVNVIADISYVAGRNEVSFLNSGVADVDTSSISTGLRFETSFYAKGISFVPYYGVRFTRVESDDLEKNSFDDVQYWQFPVGVNAGYEFTCRAGWKTRFQVDTSVVPTAGTRKTYTNGVSYRIMDSLQYRFKAGLNTSRGAHAFGLNYETAFAAHGRFNQALVANYQFMY